MGTCHPPAQDIRAYIQENGRPSRNWRRIGQRRGKATGVHSKQIWQLSQRSGKQPSARPERTGRPPKNGAGRARRAVEMTQRESTKKGDPDRRLENMTTEQQPGRPTTEYTEPGWPQTGWTTNVEAHNWEGPKPRGARDRDSPQPGGPTTGKAHRRGGTQQGRPKTGRAYNREERREQNGATWPALLALRFC